MCEIFFMKKTKGTLDISEVEELLKVAESSAISNSDGFGFFTDTGIVKCGEQLKAETHRGLFLDKIRGAKYVVMHVRKATSGEVSTKNAHPFEEKGWTLVHNGVIPEYSNKGKPPKVDSQILLESIANKHGKDDVDKIKKALKKVSGWLSVFARSPSGDLYYFKHRANFEFGYIKELNLLIGATTETSLDEMFTADGEKIKNFFKVEKYVKSRREPEEDILYKIGGEFENMGEFECKAYTYVYEKKPYNGSTMWNNYGTRCSSYMDDDEWDYAKGIPLGKVDTTTPTIDVLSRMRKRDMELERDYEEECKKWNELGYEEKYVSYGGC